MSLVSLPSIEPWSLAALLANDATTGTWAVACAPPKALDTVAQDLREQMASLFDEPVVLVDAGTALRVVEEVELHCGSALVMVGLQDWSDSEWERLDRLRSRLAREHPTLLVLDESSVAKLSAHAPNLWSWVGGTAWVLNQAAQDTE